MNLLSLTLTSGDLRRYISTTYQLRSSELVFINLSHIEQSPSDNQALQDSSFLTTDAMCVMELHPLMPNKDNNSVNNNRTETQIIPLMNVIGINVYYQEDTSNRRLVCHGMPFVLLINRDCTYSELCRKLLEAQCKYFKDKNMLKYKVRFAFVIC